MEVRSPKTFKAQPRASEQWEATEGIGFIFCKVRSGYHEGIRWQEGQVDLCENPTYVRNQLTKDAQGIQLSGRVLTLLAQGPGYFPSPVPPLDEGCGELGLRLGWSDPEADEGLSGRAGTLRGCTGRGRLFSFPPIGFGHQFGEMERFYPSARNLQAFTHLPTHSSPPHTQKKKKHKEEGSQAQSWHGCYLHNHFSVS